MMINYMVKDIMGNQFVAIPSSYVKTLLATMRLPINH